MYKLILLLNTILLLPTIVLSQTQISGQIRSNTTWTSTGSPYTCTGLIEVAPNVTLTVEPGVTVILDGGIQVYGDLIISGMKGNIVTLKGKDNNTTIQYKNRQSTNRIEYKYINIETVGISFNEQTTNTLIEHCNFKSGFVYWQGGMGKTLTIQNNILDKYQVTLYNKWGAVEQVVIKNNTILGTRRKYSNWSVNGSLLCNKPILIENNIFSGNETSIYLDANEIDIKDNTFNNNIFAITHSRNLYNKLKITSNIFTNCNVAIRILVRGSGANTEILNNSIYNNRIGIAINYSNDRPHIVNPPDVTIIDNCLYNNEVLSLAWGCTGKITVGANWWGTIDSNSIDSFIYDNNDDFKVGVVDYKPFHTKMQNGCKALPTTSIPKQLKASDLLIYPTPYNNTITFDLGTKKASSLSLYDIVGREVVSLSNINNKVTINTGTQPKGVYIYKIIFTDNTTKAGRIIKE